MKIYVTIPGTRRAGLFSYIMQALHNLSVIDNTENKIYIKYDDHMLYQDLRLGKNVWNYYFDQPFTFTEEEVKDSVREKVIFIEDKKAIPFAFTPRLGVMEIDKGRQLVKKYVQVKDHILLKVDNFLKNNFNGEEFFSIHRRGTDHYKDNPLIDLSEYIDKADSLLEEYNFGLICTDEEYVIDVFKKRYGNRMKSYNSIRCNNNLGVHYSVGLKEPYRMGEDVLVESILMSKSKHLVKTVSGVTSFSILYGKPAIEELDLQLNYS